VQEGGRREERREGRKREGGRRNERRWWQRGEGESIEERERREERRWSARGGRRKKWPSEEVHRLTEQMAGACCEEKCGRRGGSRKGKEEGGMRHDN
jgi:hypothetical protein